MNLVEKNALDALSEAIIEVVDRDAGGVLSDAILAMVGGEGGMSIRRAPDGDLVIDVNGPRRNMTICIQARIWK